MSDWKKTTEELKTFISEKAGELVQTAKEQSKNIADYAKLQKQKLELKAQIGEHSRALNKSYARLGEAYYDAKTSGKPLEGVEDVLALIKSNKQLIALLEEKLVDLAPKNEDGEECTECSETCACEEEKNDTDSFSQIHID